MKIAKLIYVIMSCMEDPSQSHLIKVRYNRLLGEGEEGCKGGVAASNDCHGMLCTLGEN